MAKASQKKTPAASVEVPIPCPSWCQEEKCNGEHYNQGDAYVPATAGLPLSLDHSMGVSFPAVGVALRWGQRDNCHPGVSVHINGQNVDEEFEMQVHEARALVKSLKRAIKTLEATS